MNDKDIFKDMFMSLFLVKLWMLKMFNNQKTDDLMFPSEEKSETKISKKRWNKIYVFSRFSTGKLYIIRSIS